MVFPKLNKETSNHKEDISLTKHLDNLLLSKILSGLPVFFLMFSKLSRLMCGWFIQPFHLSFMVIRHAQRLKRT